MHFTIKPLDLCTSCFFAWISLSLIDSFLNPTSRIGGSQTHFCISTNTYNIWCMTVACLSFLLHSEVLKTGIILCYWSISELATPKYVALAYWLCWAEDTWERGDGGRFLWPSPFYQKVSQNFPWVKCPPWTEEDFSSPDWESTLKCICTNKPTKITLIFHWFSPYIS